MININKKYFLFWNELKLVKTAKNYPFFFIFHMKFQYVKSNFNSLITLISDEKVVKLI